MPQYRNKDTVTQKMIDELLDQIKREGLDHKDNAIKRQAYILGHPNIKLATKKNRYYKCKKRVNYLLNRDKDKNNFDYIKPYRPEPDEKSGISDGDIEIGRTLEGNIPVRIKLSEFLKSFCIGGMTGFGKTTLIISVIKQLIKKGISVIVSDKKGSGQFRGLQKLFPEKFLVFRVGVDIFLNFYVAPINCNSSAYLSRYSDLRNRVFERKDSKVIFDRAMNNLLALSNSNNSSFSEQDLLKEFQTMKLPSGILSHKGLKSSQIAVANDIIESELGKSLKCSRGILAGEMARNNISGIIETPSLSNLHDLFIHTANLNQAYSDLQTDALDYIDTLRQVFIFDESSHLFAKYRANLPMLELISQIRHAGIGCIGGTTNPSFLAGMFQSNVYTYCCFHLFNSEDIWTVRKSMFLTAEQAESLGHLPVFVCCVKLADRYTEPFLMKIN